MPCYNFLYKHASPRLKSKIDVREQEVEAAEHSTSSAAEDTMQQHAEKVQHALRHTMVTKRVAKLFFTNMTENDKKEEK